jgi:hypothetical protein
MVSNSADKKKSREPSIYKGLQDFPRESMRLDSNQRPLRPERSALPS